MLLKSKFEINNKTKIQTKITNIVPQIHCRTDMNQRSAQTPRFRPSWSPFGRADQRCGVRKKSSIV